MTNEVQQLIAKADVLIEALPYLRTFANKTFVIKYGGQAGVGGVKKISHHGYYPAEVYWHKSHRCAWWGPDITHMLERLGKESHFVNGLRVTDAEDIEVVEMVLTGKVNKQIVALINQYGGKAVGFVR